MRVTEVTPSFDGIFIFTAGNRKNKNPFEPKEAKARGLSFFGFRFISI